MKKWQKILILCVSCVCLLVVMIVPSFAYEINPDTFKVEPTRYTTRMVKSDTTPEYLSLIKLSYASSSFPTDENISCNSTDWLNIHFSHLPDKISVWDVGMVRLSYANHTQTFDVFKSDGTLLFSVWVSVPEQTSNGYSGELEIHVLFPNGLPYDDFYITVDVYPSFSAYSSYIKNMVGDYKTLKAERDSAISQRDEANGKIEELEKAVDSLEWDIGALNKACDEHLEDYYQLESDYQSKVDQANQAIYDRNLALQNEVVALEKQAIAEAKADALEKTNTTLTEENNKLLEALENNNALFTLGDGIGSAFSSLISTFGNMSVGGVTVASVIALAVISFITFVIIKAFKG